jgi:protein-arginine kinase activator protein McsA
MPAQLLVPITEVSLVAVKMNAERQSRRDRLMAAGCCIACERQFAPGAQSRRGQCSGCYQASLRKIRQGVVSDTDLIRDGYMLPPGPGGRKPTNPFTKYLSER